MAKPKYITRDTINTEFKIFWSFESVLILENKNNKKLYRYNSYSNQLELLAFKVN